ncbi:MAG TPA: hypothetical protein V6D47_02160 [Oscillatoriaceae cyanobacterium]
MSVYSVLPANQPTAKPATKPAGQPTNAASGPKVASDALSLSGASTIFDLPGLKPGMKLKIEKGSSFKGFGFGGTATVNAFDGKTLDMTVDAKVFHFIHVPVHLHFERATDGTICFLGERTKGGSDDKTPKGTPSKVGAALCTITQKPGNVVLRAPDGGPVTLTSDDKGNLSIAYGPAEIHLKP